MKRTVRNYIIRIAIIAAFAAAVILIANHLRPSWAESSEQRADTEITQNQDLLLWYYDEDLTPYVEQLAADYFRKEGLRVGCELVSVVSFFENINQMNVEGGKSPDLYITDTSRLEQAYLGAIAKQNAFPDIYSLQNYSVKSLTSVMYDGKQVAYPLCFDMEYFVYNRNYLEKAPETFEEITSLQEAFKKEAGSSVDMVMLYDVSDLLFNYHFIGGSIDLGGEAGDDVSKIILDEEKGIRALEAVKDFRSKVKINRNTTTYDLAENSFIYGRSMAAILKCSSLKALNREKTDYAVCPMPAVNAEIPSKALSDTFCVCVNPQTGNTEAAEKLAKYMTFDHADLIYDKTGYMSCKRMSYKENGFADVYNLYDATASFPKFLETENLWRDMKRMFDGIADGEEADAVFKAFEDAVTSQLSTRK